MVGVAGVVGVVGVVGAGGAVAIAVATSVGVCSPVVCLHYHAKLEGVLAARTPPTPVAQSRGPAKLTKLGLAIRNIYIYIYIYTYNNGMEYIIMNIQKCVYMYISIHPSVHPYIHTYIHTYSHTHTYTHTHIRTCRIIYFNISTYVRTCSNLVSYNVVSASRIPKPDSHRTLELGVQSGSVRSL